MLSNSCARPTRNVVSRTSLPGGPRVQRRPADSLTNTQANCTRDRCAKGMPRDNDSRLCKTGRWSTVVVIDEMRVGIVKHIEPRNSRTRADGNPADLAVHGKRNDPQGWPSQLHGAFHNGRMLSDTSGTSVSQCEASASVSFMHTGGHQRSHRISCRTCVHGEALGDHPLV